MTKRLSDCHGAEVNFIYNDHKVVGQSIGKYFCTECGYVCKVHEVKEEPKSEYEFYKRQLDKMKQKKEVKEEPTDKIFSEIRNSERSWKEDFSHENGNYENSCTQCGNSFFGHKRRVVCKVCSVHPPISEGEVSERDFQEILGLKIDRDGVREQAVKACYQLHLRGTAKLREEIAKLKEQLILNDIWQSDKDSEYKALYEIEYVDTLKSQIEAKEKFKEYVHMRLDKMNIPTHPDGEHSKAGCRIGDRLDIIESQLNELKK